MPVNFEKKLDFCVITTRYTDGDKNIVFVTYSGSDMVNEQLCQESDYSNLKMLLESIGYEEIDFCTFESVEKTDLLNTSETLIQMGLNYSVKLEKSMLKEVTSFFSNPNSTNNIYGAYNTNSTGILNEPVYFYNPSSTIKKVDKKIASRVFIPKNGEKITIYFYMFLNSACFTNNFPDGLEFEFIGDLFRDSGRFSNYIGIGKSEFIRIDDGSSSMMVLQSTKTYADLFKETDMLHKGRIILPENAVGDNGASVVKNNIWSYNIMEIRKRIKYDRKLVIQLDINTSYETTLRLSSVIKNKYSAYKREKIDLNSSKITLTELKKKLIDKMHKQSDSEEYEKAAVIKKDISFVEEKIKIMNTISEKTLSKKKYLALFSVPE